MKPKAQVLKMNVRGCGGSGGDDGFKYIRTLKRAKTNDCKNLGLH